MDKPVLVIGNKNYSSWSLRPWLLLKVNDVAFDEVRVALYQQGSKVAIQSHAPAGGAPYGKVPILRDGATTVWDSLAICEYAAERWPSIRGWPVDLAQRAHARAISAEMHSGFATLRSEMPMNCPTVTPSTPAAPPFSLTFNHALHTSFFGMSCDLPCNFGSLMRFLPHG